MQFLTQPLDADENNPWRRGEVPVQVYTTYNRGCL